MKQEKDNDTVAAKGSKKPAWFREYQIAIAANRKKVRRIDAARILRQQIDEGLTSLWASGDPNFVEDYHSLIEARKKVAGFTHNDRKAHSAVIQELREDFARKKAAAGIIDTKPSQTAKELPQLIQLPLKYSPLISLERYPLVQNPVITSRRKLAGAFS